MSPMSASRRSDLTRIIFVEPDDHTNQIIAEYLLTDEENLHENQPCTDGTRRTVWEFGPLNRHKLNQLFNMENVRMNLFVRVKGGLLRPISHERVESSTV
jgi:hypothetical protein